MFVPPVVICLASSGRNLYDYRSQRVARGRSLRERNAYEIYYDDFEDAKQILLLDSEAKELFSSPIILEALNSRTFNASPNSKSTVLLFEYLVLLLYKYLSFYFKWRDYL
jgi:hypothetical protein